MTATVLDTNVVSELLRSAPAPAVVRFVDSIGDRALLTTITISELVFGAERLPAGRRGDILRAAVDATIETFVAGGRCVEVDSLAAAEAGRFRAERERAGRPVNSLDTLIAGICRAHGLALATRNGRDFEDAGVTILDPWSDPPGR